MFDLDLHFRFLRKATEACFEFGQASAAAANAWQSHMHEQLNETRPGAAIEPWPAWFGFWQNAFQPICAQNEMMISAWRTMSAWQSGPWSGVTLPAMQPAAFWPMPASMTLPFPYPISFVPWTFYQTPMIAMMVSNGVPYAVAAPTARAGTSAMDAADAAYSQWRLIFGNNEVPIDRERARSRARAANRRT